MLWSHCQNKKVFSASLKRLNEKSRRLKSVGILFQTHCVAYTLKVKVKHNTHMAPQVATAATAAL